MLGTLALATAAPVPLLPLSVSIVGASWSIHIESREEDSSAAVAFAALSKLTRQDKTIIEFFNEIWDIDAYKYRLYSEVNMCGQSCN